MRGLTGAAQDERGATAITIAILLTVLLGMGAIVIDVGAIYQERRELQNGADAAALAIAEDCARGDCGTYGGTAEQLADANALDDLASVDGVAIDLAGRTATVDTSTSDAEGGARILHWFAPVLGNDGSTVEASATARWFSIQSGRGVPLTFSRCEWETAMGAAPTFPSGEVALAFHDGNAAGSCNPGPAGQDLPGGFGWLDTVAGACELDVSVGRRYSSDPGAAPPRICDPADFIDREILVPVFEDVGGSGQGGWFQIWGLATFKVTGMRLLMGNGAWTWGDISLCSTGNSGQVPGPGGGGGGKGGGGPAVDGGTGNDQACIVGNFVRDVDLGATSGSGTAPDLGTLGIELIK